MGAKPAKEEEVRRAMIPAVRKSCVTLEAVLTELRQTDDPHIPDARGDQLRDSVLQVVNEFDSTLWECTVSVFGLRRTEADPKAANNTAKYHTQEFNARVARLSDMMTAEVLQMEEDPVCYVPDGWMHTRVLQPPAHRTTLHLLHSSICFT